MPPLSLLIKPVSGRCNMRCRYCFYAEETALRAAGDAGVMSERTLENLMRRAFRHAEGAAYFAFQGGEPTLAGVDYYRQVIRWQEQLNTRGIEVVNSLQTNGLALSDELIELLAAHRFLVGVSVDGTQALHDRMRLDAAGQGTWTRVRANIERLREKGVAVNILCVVNRYVAQQPREVFEALRADRFLQFIPCMEPLSGEKTDWALDAASYRQFMTEAFRLYKRAWLRNDYVSVRAFDNYVRMSSGEEPDSCAMQGHCAPHYVIEADGSVYPCDFYALDEWKLGNINQVSFDRLARSPLAARFRALSEPVPRRCQACELYPLCRNGCRRDRVLKNGEYVSRYCVRQ